MKHIYLIFAAFIFTACSKEDTYGPWKLKDGQEVELLVSHRYGAIGDTPLLLPQNASPSCRSPPLTKGNLAITTG